MAALIWSLLKNASVLILVIYDNNLHLEDYYVLSNFRLNLRDRNQYFKKLGPSASLRAIRMCLQPKLDNSNNAFASSEALGCASCHLLYSCMIAILFPHIGVLFRTYTKKINVIVIKWLSYNIVIMH